MGLIQLVGHLKGKIFKEEGILPQDRNRNSAPFAIPLRNLDSYGTCQAGRWQIILLQLRSHLCPKAGTLEGSEQNGSRYGPSDGLSSSAMWTTDLAQSSREVSEDNRYKSHGEATVWTLPLLDQGQALFCEELYIFSKTIPSRVCFWVLFSGQQVTIWSQHPRRTRLSGTH